MWKDKFAEKDKIVNWIKEWFTENGDSKTKAVIGISGGKDSTVATALCVEALGRDRVIGVLMPNSEQSDFKDAMKVVQLFGIKHYVIDIGNTVDTLYETIADSMNINSGSLDDNVIVNTPPRIRMTVLYAVAANFGNARVICTDNASESYIGYSTKYGDLAGDVAPLADIPASLVVDLGRAFALSYNIPALLPLVEKTPSDGLCGKTDEDALGFTYEQLDNYLFNNEIEYGDAYDKIVSRHKRNLHKECIMLPRYKAIIKSNIEDDTILVET